MNNIKIAFASKDNIHVNQHFGWAEKFYLYEINSTNNNYKLIQEIDSSVKHTDEVDKLTYKIECVQDADILYVAQIGPKASNMVKTANIFPLKASSEDEKITDVLDNLLKLINQSNSPLWLKRILFNKN
jgi:nitrogen fixation protein NifX